MQDGPFHLACDSFLVISGREPRSGTFHTVQVSQLIDNIFVWVREQGLGRVIPSGSMGF